MTSPSVSSKNVTVKEVSTSGITVLACIEALDALVAALGGDGMEAVLIVNTNNSYTFRAEISNNQQQ